MGLRITLTVAEARQIITMVRWLDGGDDGAEEDYDLADRLCDEIGDPRPAWRHDPRPHDSEDTPMATGHPSPGFPGITVVPAGWHVEIVEAPATTPRHRDYNAMRGALADPVTHLADGHVTRHPHTIRATAHGHDAVIDGDPPLQADHQPGHTRSGRLAAVVFRTPGWTGPATAEVHIDDPARPVVTIPDVPEHHARHALDYIGHRVLVQDVNDGTRDLILGGPAPRTGDTADRLEAAEARAATAAADNARLRRQLDIIAAVATGDMRP